MMATNYCIYSYIYWSIGSLDADNDNEMMVAGIMLIISVYILYAAFMTEGQTQTRLAVVIAGPIVVWFLICAGLELDVTYATDPVPWELSTALVPPLFFWGMTALTGVLAWNSEE